MMISITGQGNLFFTCTVKVSLRGKGEKKYLDKKCRGEHRSYSILAVYNFARLMGIGRSNKVFLSFVTFMPFIEPGTHSC